VERTSGPQARVYFRLAAYLGNIKLAYAEILHLPLDRGLELVRPFPIHFEDQVRHMFRVFLKCYLEHFVDAWVVF
jgi:hypothetical protein